VSAVLAGGCATVCAFSRRVLRGCDAEGVAALSATTSGSAFLVDGFCSAEALLSLLRSSTDADGSGTGCDLGLRPRRALMDKFDPGSETLAAMSSPPGKNASVTDISVGWMSRGLAFIPRRGPLVAAGSETPAGVVACLAGFSLINVAARRAMLGFLKISLCRYATALSPHMVFKLNGRYAKLPRAKPGS